MAVKGLKVVLSVTHKPTAGRAQFGPFSSTKVIKSEYLVLKIVKSPKKLYVCLNNAFTAVSECAKGKKLNK